MRRWHATLVALLVAVVIHLDWHLARPAHHRLSLAWRQHWIVAAAAFAGIGWLVARRWPDQPWRAASGVVVAGVFVGQGLEPVVEYWLAHGQLGYSGETARWRAFLLSLGTGLLALGAAIALERRRTGREGAPAV